MYKHILILPMSYVLFYYSDSLATATKSFDSTCTTKFNVSADHTVAINNVPHDG